MEKAQTPHSSTLTWKIPWTKESSRLRFMGSLRVMSFSLFPFMHWGRKWQPTPVFLPGESQGWRSLVGCRLWGRTASDTTEAPAAAAAQLVKNPPAMQETLVQFLGQEDSLEEGMTTHSSILAWRILWTEEPGRQQSMGSQRVRGN